MDVYKAMFLKLFNSVTDSITQLKAAQSEAEEYFMEHGFTQNEETQKQ